MFISLRVADILRRIYDNYLLNEDTTLKSNDTYFIVFGPRQHDLESIFNKINKFKVLYKSPLACNTTHPGEPRNTLYIFEVDETLPLRTLPKVS